MTEVLYGWYSEKQACISNMRPTSVRYWTPSGEKVWVTCVSPTMDHGMGYDDMVFVGEVTKMAEQYGMPSGSDLITDIRSWHPPSNYSRLHKDGIEPRTIKEATNSMQDTTGLCTVRAMAAQMEVSKVREAEMYFESDGKRWNVELRITRCEAISGEQA